MPSQEVMSINNIFPYPKIVFLYLLLKQFLGLSFLMMEKNWFLPKKCFLSLCLKLTTSIFQAKLVWMNPECNVY